MEYLVYSKTTAETVQQKGQETKAKTITEYMRHHRHRRNGGLEN